MAYYLGIDGGGTKTRCVLADEATVLATAMTGGCSVIRHGEQRAREALHAAVRQVCATAGVSADRISSICIGVTGAARPEIAAKIRGILTELIPEGTPTRIEVVGDNVIALEAAFGAGPGVIAIAGTIGYIAAGLPHQALLPPMSLGFVSLTGVAVIAPISSWAAPWGALLAHALPRRWLEIALGAFLLLVAVRFVASLA